jgi:nucleoid DNA-binding protein
MGTLIKKDCVDVVRNIVSNVSGSAISSEQAATIYDLMVDSFTRSLNKGDEVGLSRIGKFYTKTVAAHPARNPRTGETVTVAEKRKVMFRPYNSFIDATTEL